MRLHRLLPWLELLPLDRKYYFANHCIYLRQAAIVRTPGTNWRCIMAALFSVTYPTQKDEFKYKNLNSKVLHQFELSNLQRRIRPTKESCVGCSVIEGHQSTRIKLLCVRDEKIGQTRGLTQACPF